jgi:hypothetical protein
MAGNRSASLKRLLTVVLGLTEDDKPWMLVHYHIKCNTLLAFDRLTAAQLSETFEWTPSNATAAVDTVLDPPEIDELRDIQEWIRFNKTSVTADWITKTPDDFATFTQSLIQVPTAIIMATAATTTAAATVNPAPPVAITLLTAYGLKRDLKDYPDITQRHFYLDWVNKVRTTAIIHNSSDPLDSTYKPHTDMEKAIFRLDNTFMYAVLLRSVKYSSGKTIVGKHKLTMDGQACFAELTEEANGVAVRQINELKCQEALKDMDCDPNKWSQPLENFIDLWITRKGHLDDVRIVSLPDDEAITWFTHSVRNNPILLHAIQQQENMKSVFLRSFPGKVFVQSLGNFLDDIRMTCVCYDNVNSKKPAKTPGSGSTSNNTVPTPRGRGRSRTLRRRKPTKNTRNS